jgi:tetratricopeptide (TPR) repeat protein
MGQEQLDEAQAALDEAQQIKPDNPEVHYYRGILAGHRKDYNAAVAAFEKALELKPDHVYAHYHAGLAYNILKRPDKMLEHFHAFLKLAPDAPEAPKVKTVLQTGR